MTTNKLFAFTLFLFALAIYILIAIPKAIAAPNCAATIASNDAMQFDAKSIDISKSCKEFTVTLEHTGKMPKNIMGHNLVVTKESDQKAVISNGAKAGASSEYIEAGDSRVLMATKIIGGGEKTTATIKVSQLNAKDKYVFFCSFPGHAFMMKGELKLI